MILWQGTIYPEEFLVGYLFLFFVSFLVLFFVSLLPYPRQERLTASSIAGLSTPKYTVCFSNPMETGNQPWNFLPEEEKKNKENNTRFFLAK